MTTPQAIAECLQWFAYLDAQRARAAELARLALLARTSSEGQMTAMRERRRIDTTPVAYDGAELERAVAHLVGIVEARP